MPHALTVGTHSPQPFSPEMEPLDGWTGGVPVAQMCVHAYGRHVSVVDVGVFCACARGERLLGVINIIMEYPPDAHARR